MNTEWHHNVDPQSENEVKIGINQNATKCAKNEKSAMNLVQQDRVHSEKNAGNRDQEESDKHLQNVKWNRWTEAVKQFAMNRSKNDDVVEELEVSISSDYDGAVLKAVQWWLRVWQFGQLADIVAIWRLGSSDHDRADFRAVQ